MKPVLTSEQMAEADRHTIQDLGVPGIELMERAANACAAILMEQLGPDDWVAVMAGGGNNGGDGFAVARLLIEQGVAVTTWLATPRSKLKGDARINFERLRALDGASIIECADQQAPTIPADVTWIVDALFGTGLSQPVRPPLSDWIHAINQAPARVLAVDLPSGYCGSHGRGLGEGVQADITVTFEALKPAHVVTPAALACRTVFLRSIGIEVPASPFAWFLEADDYERPKRELESHKGRFGTLGVIGGFPGMEGAASLCAMAGLRFGAGKVRILTMEPGSPRFHHDSVMLGGPAQMADLSAYDALVMGPGLSREPEAWDLVSRVGFGPHRVVWDADGLVYLKRRAPEMGAAWVMTPHTGEAAILLDCTAAEVQRDRLAAVNALGEAYPGGWILLKGYRTLIRAPDGRLFICGTGNAALAVAGSGDVLSGMIGAMLAQGFSLERAVTMACLRHGMAGDHWVVAYRDYSMLAEDILDDLRF